MDFFCARCGTKLISANAETANYVFGPEWTEMEPRELLYAEDEEGVETQVGGFNEAEAILDFKRVVAREEIVPVQKTAIVCDLCLRPEDILIWGNRERAEAIQAGKRWPPPPIAKEENEEGI